MKLKDALKWYDESPTSNNDNVCLISKQPISNKITLKCGHCFEYDSLLKYYIKSKSYPSSHKCPYCRETYNGFVPMYENSDYLKSINDQIIIKKYFRSNDYLKCEYCFKTGKNKGNICNAVAHKFDNGNYCNRHHGMINKCNKKKNEVVVQCCKILKTNKQCKNKMFDPTTGLCKRHFNLYNKLNNSS
jgi:hypothetical protein